MLKLLIIKLPSLKLWTILKVKDRGEHFRDESRDILTFTIFHKRIQQTRSNL